MHLYSADPGFDCDWKESVGYCHYSLLPTNPPVDVVWAMMIVRRIKENIIRTVLCCVVYDSCAHWHARAHTHTWAVLIHKCWFRSSFCAFVYVWHFVCFFLVYHTLFCSCVVCFCCVKFNFFITTPKRLARKNVSEMTYRISSNTSRALNTSRASNISRDRGLHTDRVWQVCTVCASLVCIMARYEAAGINILTSISDRQSEPITNLLTRLLFLWNTRNVTISSS